MDPLWAEGRMRSQKQVFYPVITCLLLPLGLMLAPGPAHAQASSDTTARSDTSTAQQPADDSLASKGVDSARAQKPDSGAAQPRPAVTPPAPLPVDSAFNAACNPPPPNTPAASLLLVTFSPTLTERERLDIAKHMGGSLVGIAATGERYFRVSGGGSPRAAADALILYQGVQQVSERPCPAVVPGER
jgi:hypothetical protein